MPMEIQGKLHKVLDTKQVSDRFRKCDFVVELEDGKYPQLVSFQIVNDKIDQLAAFKVGDEVRVTFNLRGREWTSPSGEVKFFNTLDAWKVEKMGAQQSRGGAHESPPPTGVATDDIPFIACELAAEPSPIARVLR